MLVLGAMLSACSSAMVDHIPTSLGGLPEGVPQRPAVQPAYPAVHDMPPPRQDATLSDAERKRLAEELAASGEGATAPEVTNSTRRNAGGARNP